MRSIHWFRKGLRLHDNPTLLESIKDNAQCIPIFILDQWHRNNVGDLRIRFILESLQDLDRELRLRGSTTGLLFFQCEPSEIFPILFEELKPNRITFDDSEENEPHCVQEDEWVCDLARKLDVKVVTAQSHTLHSAEAYEKALHGSKVPLTFGKFLELFRKVGQVKKPLDSPETVKGIEESDLPKAVASAMSSFDSLKHVKESSKRVRNTSKETLEKPLKFPGGETEALKRLQEVITERPGWVKAFEKPKTEPNTLEPSTSVLSPYLASGCLSVRTLWWATCEAQKATGNQIISAKYLQTSFAGQLLWRETWYAIARFTPADIGKMKGNPLCRQIPWDNDPQLLQAWKEGKTGYPFVDALMNQLREEGWVHHLGRHMVACFLTRGDLWQSWEKGAQVFDEFLLDSDWSINNCNWMWLSCSAFFHQYFRCYSPVAFGKKTDKNGDFIRKYVPVLRNFPAKYIYEPWKAPSSIQKESGCIIGKDYPERIVKDHTVTSKANMNRMKEAYQHTNNEKTAKATQQKKRGASEITKYFLKKSRT